MDNIEMTDADGDSVTLQVREDGTWITCTTTDGEVTVGPLPTSVLQVAVAKAGVFSATQQDCHAR
ncbi:hypothetical protein I8D64_03165 [Brachybacterium sp. MASK1Z-5]|uniref:Uncharacterized protein n=1 Tax=Brachybacterium halotolerans TaxID=2795215 RepID=A0ABS1B701_9MICO|nr:hypothetical protein [Brachybacterium halotolerans]MBK0330398.1 hypothetical protein [Brachybacterium halotolerans]